MKISSTAIFFVFVIIVSVSWLATIFIQGILFHYDPSPDSKSPWLIWKEPWVWPFIIFFIIGCYGLIANT